MRRKPRKLKRVPIRRRSYFMRKYKNLKQRAKAIRAHKKKRAKYVKYVVARARWKRKGWTGGRSIMRGR